MAIRVLRLIEYVYEDEEAYTHDRMRWTMSHNGLHMQMRSAELQPEHVAWQEVNADGTSDH